MRIALTHNLRVTDSEEEAEFDSPEAVQAIARALSKTGHYVECIDVTGPASRLVTRLEVFAPDIIFNVAEGRRILQESGLNLTTATDLTDAAKKVVAAAK